MNTQVSDQDLELLSQWVDGELNEVDSRRLQQRVTAEANLLKALGDMRALNANLRQAMSDRASVPESISARLQDTSTTTGANAQAASVANANVVAFPPARATGEDLAQREQRRWPVAIAASIAAAVAVLLLNPQSAQFADNPNGLPGNDSLVSASLDVVASGGEWAELADGRAIQPVLSFAHRDGTWCREYLLRTQESDWRAVACREEDRWVTQAAGLESYLDSANAYRPAGAGVSENAPVSVFINENAADIALGWSEEQALIADTWR